MLCDRCKINPATIQVTTIQNGEKIKKYLCASCAAETGNISINPFDDFFKSLLDFSNLQPSSETLRKEISCPMCHITYNDFKKSGKFGCSTCYSTFKDHIDYILKRIQGNTKHIGKIPEKAGIKIKKKNELAILKDKLNKAISAEEFEEAAKLRDKIRALEKEGNGDECK